MSLNISPIAHKLQVLVSELYSTAKVLDSSKYSIKYQLIKALNREFQTPPIYKFSNTYLMLLPEEKLKEKINPEVIEKVHIDLRNQIKEDLKEEDSKLGINTEKTSAIFQALLQEADLKESIGIVIVTFTMSKGYFKELKIPSNTLNKLAVIFNALANELLYKKFTFPMMLNGTSMNVLVDPLVCRTISRDFRNLALNSEHTKKVG